MFLLEAIEIKMGGGQPSSAGGVVTDQQEPTPAEVLLSKIYKISSKVNQILSEQKVPQVERNRTNLNLPYSEATKYKDDLSVRERVNRKLQKIQVLLEGHIEARKSNVILTDVFKSEMISTTLLTSLFLYHHDLDISETVYSLLTIMMTPPHSDVLSQDKWGQLQKISHHASIAREVSKMFSLGLAQVTEVVLLRTLDRDNYQLVDGSVYTFVERLMKTLALLSGEKLPQQAADAVEEALNTLFFDSQVLRILETFFLVRTRQDDGPNLQGVFMSLLAISRSLFKPRSKRHKLRKDGRRSVGGSSARFGRYGPIFEHWSVTGKKVFTRKIATVSGGGGQKEHRGITRAQIRSNRGPPPPKPVISFARPEKTFSPEFEMRMSELFFKRLYEGGILFFLYSRYREALIEHKDDVRSFILADGEEMRSENLAQIANLCLIYVVTVNLFVSRPEEADLKFIGHVLDNDVYSIFCQTLKVLVATGHYFTHAGELFVEYFHLLLRLQETIGRDLENTLGEQINDPRWSFNFRLCTLLLHDGSLDRVVKSLFTKKFIRSRHRTSAEDHHLVGIAHLFLTLTERSFNEGLHGVVSYLDKLRLFASSHNIRFVLEVMALLKDGEQRDAHLLSCVRIIQAIKEYDDLHPAFFSLRFLYLYDALITKYEDYKEVRETLTDIVRTFFAVYAPSDPLIYGKLLFRRDDLYLAPVYKEEAVEDEAPPAADGNEFLLEIESEEEEELSPLDGDDEEADDSDVGMARRIVRKMVKEGKQEAVRLVLEKISQSIEDYLTDVTLTQGDLVYGDRINIFFTVGRDTEIEELPSVQELIVDVLGFERKLASYYEKRVDGGKESKDIARIQEILTASQETLRSLTEKGSVSSSRIL